MDYYNSYTDPMGFVHSIDMVYAEYMTWCSVPVLLGKLREFHEQFPDLEYVEYLDRPYHSKWSYYLDAVKFDGVYIEFGKYNNYDKVSGTFDLINMFQIRFNPNKFMSLDWFQALLLILIDVGSSGRLRKYDYAIDIRAPMAAVQLFNCRREPGLYKGTRYYGQAGRHGYTKVYDKYKDLFRQGIVVDAPLTRVEQTLFTNQAVALEQIWVMDNNLQEDYSSLQMTDRAIIEMYSRLRALGDNYDLQLGKDKMKKLRPYLYGGYKKVEYSDILELLLVNIRKYMHVDLIVKDENGFLLMEDDEELPFD